MLHVTNGDSAAERIRAAGEAGEILSWRDVLHEGPVPAGLDASALREVRARFLVDSEWASFDAVLADLEARDATLASANEREIVLCNTREGLFALSNVCTHAFARMSEGFLKGTRLTCPLHGASFDVRTGKVLGGPTGVPLPSYPVRVTNGVIEVALPSDAPPASP